MRSGTFSTEFVTWRTTLTNQLDAAGILAAPSIVFLDEPTSGLDSFAALTVMGHLKRMARDNGHVVIASIHQPRSAIWSMFDRVSAVTKTLSKDPVA